VTLERPHLEAARVPAPIVRRLRVLAFDPSLATRLSTAAFNAITVAIPWEPLQRGPVGEYLGSLTSIRRAASSTTL
jgi:hypothetical protein